MGTIRGWRSTIGASSSRWIRRSRRCLWRGGTIDEIAGDDHNSPASLALDAEAVYFSVGGEVRRVLEAGGPVTVLYQAQIVLDVCVARGFVYAARNVAFDRGRVTETAAIVRIATPGGPASVMADLNEGASPQSLTVDATGVFVALLPFGPGASADRFRIVEYPTAR